MEEPTISSSQTFQSTLPVGGATGRDFGYVPGHRHFNPRSPWGERPLAKGNVLNKFAISIHAPRGGSDLCNSQLHVDVKLFQSTLPVGGATWNPSPGMVPAILFQSTLPVGGATRCISAAGSCAKYFNPRSPWGERQQRCTDFSVNLWQKCIFSECFLRKSPGYSGWIFGKPLFLPQKFLRTSREFLGALASHGGRLTISQRISVSSGR